MRCTEPLSADYPSEADWLLPILRIAWKTPEDPNFKFDEWQEDLLKRILEVYPEGHPRAGELRFRQVVISMGRQNGKSLLAASLGVWSLLRAPGTYTVGIASSAEQARIVYDRTMFVIRSNKSLNAMFEKLTDTRGIVAKDGGRYEIKAAKSGALQGLPVSVGLVDELHLLPSTLWTDLVNGTGGRKNGIVIGITTAGDENSDLLKGLYEAGEKAIAGDPNLDRFGFFCWEAPEALVPQDDEMLLEYLTAANPALQAGRLDAENILSDVRSMPDTDIIRYRLNRFVYGTSVFISPSLWSACARPTGLNLELNNTRPVFAIDRSPDWGHATIAVALKRDDGITDTELVASIVKPNLEQLVHLCLQLSKYSPQTFIVDSYGLRELALELKKRGMPTTIATQGDIVNASSMVYAKIMQRKIWHSSDPLLTVQFPRTIRKNVGDQYRISRKDSSIEIDAVMATVLAIYGAETRLEQSLQVF